MSFNDKPLIWRTDVVKTPPMGTEARREAGFLLRRLQAGESLGPEDGSKPLPSVGSRIHELKINDGEKNVTWRIVYRIDSDAIVVAGWFKKKSQKLPKNFVDTCRKRLKKYDELIQE